MKKLSSQATETINRNALVSVALKQGYNAYLPVCDEGIDLILHCETLNDTKLIQLKSRWTISKKYSQRNIWIAFANKTQWYLAPHDKMVEEWPHHTQTASWAKGTYSKATLSKQDLQKLEQYRFGDAFDPLKEAASKEKLKA